VAGGGRGGAEGHGEGVSGVRDGDEDVHWWVLLIHARDGKAGADGE